VLSGIVMLNFHS